jgi:hypothetical protein
MPAQWKLSRRFTKLQEGLASGLVDRNHMITMLGSDT